MSEQILENLVKLHILKNKVFETQLEEIFQKADENGLEIITIKGWSVARLYKVPRTRLFRDIDICVHPEQFEKAVELFDGKYNIDFHKGSRHLDTVNWENLYENSKLVNTEKAKIRVLSDEDHLRILAVHWLTDSGSYKDRLWDFYFLLESNDKFDWEKCLDVVSKTRRKWIICTLGLAEIHTDLNLSKTPITNAKQQIPKWLFKALKKEWNSEMPLLDIPNFRTGDRKVFWQQIKKRFPPNPILATIDLEGEFDNSWRITYQIGDLFYRTKNSLKKRFNNK